MKKTLTYLFLLLVICSCRGKFELVKKHYSRGFTIFKKNAAVAEPKKTNRDMLKISQAPILETGIIIAMPLHEANIEEARPLAEESVRYKKSTVINNTQPYLSKKYLAANKKKVASRFDNSPGLPRRIFLIAFFFGIIACILAYGAYGIPGLIGMVAVFVVIFFILMKFYDMGFVK